MASVSSRGPTPHSPYDFESGAETDESWQYLDYSYAPSSVGFLPSPASGSLNGYAVVGNVAGSDPASLSPLNLDHLDQGAFSAAAFPDQSEAFTAPTSSADGQFNAGAQDPDILTPQGYLFSQQLSGEHKSHDVCIYR